MAWASMSPSAPPAPFHTDMFDVQQDPYMREQDPYQRQQELQLRQLELYQRQQELRQQQEELHQEQQALYQQHQSPAMLDQLYMGEPDAERGALDVSPIKPEKEAKTGCREWPFALVFILNISAIIVFMVIWGIDAVTDSSSSQYLSPEDMKVMTGVVVGMALLSVVLALVAVKLIVAYPRCMVLCVLLLSAALSFAFATYYFYRMNFLGSVGMILGLVIVGYAIGEYHRIPLAVANLRVAKVAISQHSSTYLVSIVFSIVQLVWIVVWVLALLGATSQMPDSESTMTSSFFRWLMINLVPVFFLWLSFYWGLQVFRNIVHTTVAGAVASFWYSAESGDANDASLRRAITSSFGSICFGSLFLTFVQPLAGLMEQRKGVGLPLPECAIRSGKALRKYSNRWAYVYVGVYGYKFTEASKLVTGLFHQRGFHAIIKDAIVSNVLSFAATGVGFLCLGIVVLLVEMTDFITFQYSTNYLALLAYVVGSRVATTLFTVVNSSVDTIFVYFAEDPAVFQRGHQDLYDPLVGEWHKQHPKTMVRAGYWSA